MPSLFAKIFRNGIEPKKPAAAKVTSPVSLPSETSDKPVKKNASHTEAYSKKAVTGKTAETPSLFNLASTPTRVGALSISAGKKQSVQLQPVFKQVCPRITVPLSGAKVEAFFACPLKFKFSYIQKRRNFSSASSGPSFTLSLDRIIHDTLACFYRSSERSGILSENQLLKTLELILKRSVFSNEETALEVRSEAQRMLTLYLATHSQIQSTVIETDYFFKTEILGNSYSGKIDRADILPDGTIQLIDYKTGKVPMGGEEYLKKSFAAGMLLTAAEALWPGKKINSLRYIFLKDGIDIVIDKSQINKEEILKKYAECCTKISKDEFEGIKGSLCSWCEHLNICPEWPIKPNEAANEPIEDYRKRFRLSYSKLSAYLKCPRAYKFSYVDKIPQTPQPYFDFGTTIHEVFERVYAPTRTTRPSLQEFLDTYEEVRPKYRAGFELHPETEEEYHEKGIKILTDYYKHFVEGKEFAPAYSTEAYFEFPCGKHAVMAGFIDRTDRFEDGSYEILDYKTEPSTRSQEEVDKDMQLTVYYIAGKRVFGQNIKKLSLLMLDHDQKIETFRSDSDTDQVIADIDKAAEKIINDTEFLPKKNQYCQSCDHLNECPLKEEILKDESLVFKEPESTEPENL